MAGLGACAGASTSASREDAAEAHGSLGVVIVLERPGQIKNGHELKGENESQVLRGRGGEEGKGEERKNDELMRALSRCIGRRQDPTMVP